MDLVEVIRCRDCIHARHREDMEHGMCVCMVREGLGCFIVKENGYCSLAEDARRRCVRCKHFREYEHEGSAGQKYDGICCLNKYGAHARYNISKACGGFEPRE